MKTIFALVDCNNFYASCERVFNPALEGKPIVVLSNNDGCIIARSSEAKQLGIPMGAPYYQWKSLMTAHKVHVFSSNFEFYGDMSRRVMNILESFCPDIELYSIDEAFLSLHKFSHLNLNQFITEIRAAIKMWTGLPVAIGFAPTKTLAKVANHIAKNNTFTGVFDLCDPHVQEIILSQFPVENLWGVGRKIAKRLRELNIYTARDLRDSDAKFLRQKFNVVMEKMIQELRGISCLPLESVQSKKQIMSSRSFAYSISDLSSLEEAVSHYTAKACQKLRKQKCGAGGVYIFLQTNKFRKTEKQYGNGVSINFSKVTQDTGYIISKAKEGLRKIFRKGYKYHKAGVMLLELVPDNFEQADIFMQESEVKSENKMQVVDAINQLFGKNTIQFCTEGIKKPWQVKCDRRSPRYTTRKDELKKVRCG